MAIDSTMTDIKVCANALTKIGDKEISDFTSESNQPAGGICERLYPVFKRSILADYPWKFAFKKLQLSQDAVAPINQWDHQYLFPGDRVENGVYALFDTDDVDAPTFRNFEIFGERIMSNADALWMDYVYDALEKFWPFDFIDFMQTAFAAEIVVAVKGEQSRGLRNDLLIEAYGDPAITGVRGRGKYQKVKTSNSIDSPSMSYGDNTLEAARFGGIFPTITGGERFIF